MKRILRIGGFLVAIAAAPVQAQVMNFHNAYNYANDPGNFSTGGPLYGSMVYSGQGAFSDPGNNVWNGFGGGFGSYSANGYSPGNNGRTTDPARQPTGAHRYSDGSLSPISLTLGGGYFADNGGLHGTGNTWQGQPGFVLGESALVGGTPGTFQLNNVPAGVYDLYLYGANFDGTRGATFGITVGGGSAAGGINTAINPNAAPSGPLNSFVLGQNYVLFQGVSPVGGIISGTWSAVFNPISGLGGEGNFNGLQLVAVVPEPASFTLFGLGGTLLLLRRRSKS